MSIIIFESPRADSTAPRPICRQTYERAHFTIHVVPAGPDQCYCTAAVANAEVDPVLVAEQIYRFLLAFLQEHQLEVVHERWFGNQAFHLPASTGIQGDNPLGAACVMDLLAVIGETATRPDIVRLTNLKQKDAFRYGAAFSRGIILREPEVTQVQVSGTAAIDEEGKSLCPNDVRAQIQRTFDNIEALVAQAQGTLHDIASATVFLKRPEDAAAYHQIAAQRGMAQMPVVCVIADICREELLFELDAVAVVGQRPPVPGS